MSLPFIPTACETSETWVYCLFPSMLTSVRVCMWFHVRNCVFACLQMQMQWCQWCYTAVYVYVCVWERERVGCVFLNFQRIQTAHTLLQHISLWHPVLGMVHAVLTQLSPSLLHFPLLFLLRTFFCCSIQAFLSEAAFYWNSPLEGVFF